MRYFTLTLKYGTKRDGAPQNVKMEKSLKKVGRGKIREKDLISDKLVPFIFFNPKVQLSLSVCVCPPESFLSPPPQPWDFVCCHILLCYMGSGSELGSSKSLVFNHFLVDSSNPDYILSMHGHYEDKRQGYEKSVLHGGVWLHSHGAPIHLCRPFPLSMTQ